MDLILERKYKGEHYTIGKLFVNGEYFCDTLEDAVRGEKIKGITAIPSGRYEVVLTMSNHFTRVLPQLLYVKDFSGVRIHRGNDEEDTEGCILLGENKVKGKVINSTKYEMELIIKLLNERETHITIL